jgi:hypothetical protein
MDPFFIAWKAATPIMPVVSSNLTRNTVHFGDALSVTVLSRPTTVQQRAFQLLGLKHDV